MKTQECTNCLGLAEAQTRPFPQELLPYPPQDPGPARAISREDFRFLVVRAIQRSGASYRAQRRACAIIDPLLPETYEADLDHQVQQLAARCLRDTKPVYYRPRKRSMPPPADQPPPIIEQPVSGPRPMKSPVTLGRGPLRRTYTDFAELLAAIFAWEDEVKRLRECENLTFRQIARRLYLTGPMRARSLYARARRRKMAALQVEGGLQ